MKRFKNAISLMLAILLCFTASYSFNLTACAEESTEAAEEVTDEVVSDDEEETDDRIIPDGISIEGTDVSGMTVTEAKAVVKEFLSKYDDVRFTLSANGKTIEATGAELCISAGNDDICEKAATYGTTGNLIERFKAENDLKNGVKKDFKISVSANTSGVINYLESVESQLNDDACDNYVTRVDGEFEYHEGTTGVVIMVSKSAATIVDYISNDWDGSNSTIELPTEVKEPQGTEEELMEMTDLLGSFKTDYSSSSANRKNNVSNAVSFINGTVLYPGDEFSVVNTITPFTAENGYMLAGSYENGTTVETYGGGICQVSTTLYGAVRAAEIEVVTRSCHSMAVTYVQPSQDAAISESGGKDFKIRNNKTYPIYIEGYCSGGYVYFNIFGKEEREATHQVSYETEITGVAVQNTVWVADPAAPLGVMTTTVSGHTGYTARLWKIVTENGEEVSREVYNNSKYNPSDRTVTIGIASLDPNLTAAMQAAIATQNTDTIAAAVALYAPGVTNSTPFVITPQYQITATDDADTSTSDDATDDTVNVEISNTTDENATTDAAAGTTDTAVPATTDTTAN